MSQAESDHDELIAIDPASFDERAASATHRARNRSMKFPCERCDRGSEEDWQIVTFAHDLE